MKASESRKEGLQAFLSGKHIQLLHPTIVFSGFFMQQQKNFGEYYGIPTGRF